MRTVLPIEKMNKKKPKTVGKIKRLCARLLLEGGGGGGGVDKQYQSLEAPLSVIRVSVPRSGAFPRKYPRESIALFGPERQRFEFEAPLSVYMFGVPEFLKKNHSLMSAFMRITGMLTILAMDHLHNYCLG